MALLVAAVVFAFVLTLIVGLWWVSEGSRRIRARLHGTAGVPAQSEVLLEDPQKRAGRFEAVLGGTAIYGRLATLAVQAGYKRSPGGVAMLIGTFAVVGGAAGWLQTGGPLWGIPTAVVVGSLPVAHLVIRRQRRLKQFSMQFPDALDMITRAIRAGNALSGAIRLVGEEMPDPVGEEFRQVSEEIRLGIEPGEALSRMQSRVPVEDMVFFCTAIRIQRMAGGNLAEILERLAEVIRERFKLLSYARVLAAQHKWAAICVGLMPAIFSLLFQLMRPGYFEPLLKSPLGPTLIGAGAVLEAIGFFIVWRISQIKV